MDPKRLRKMLDSGKPAKIEAAQKILRSHGHYKGNIDGVAGTKTDSAIAQYEQQLRDRQAQQRRDELQQQQLEAQREAAQAKKTAAETERLRLEQEARQREEAESPYEQGRQIALFGVPAAGGFVGGYKKGQGLTRAVHERARERAASIGGLADAVRQGEVSRPVASQTAQSMKLKGPTRHGIGPLALGAGLTAFGAGQRALAPELTENPIGQDVIRGIGGLESGVGAGLAGQQIGSLIGSVPQPAARDVAAITDDANALAPARQPAVPAQTAPTQTQPATPAATNADRLKAAARAAGATGQMTKQQAADYLKANVTDANRGAVARALGVSTGRNLATRLSDKIGALASTTRRIPAIALMPPAVGYSVYDALRSPAQAGGEGEGEPMSRGEAAAAGTAAAGATAGAMEGGRRVAKRVARMPLPKAVTTAGKVAGRAANALVAPMAANDFIGELLQRQNQDQAPGERPMPDLSRIPGDMLELMMGQGWSGDQAAEAPAQPPENALAGAPEEDELSRNMDELVRLMMEEQQVSP